LVSRRSIHSTFFVWLTSAQPALGGAVPLDLAKSEVGAREVERLVGRLEHGVFS